MIPMSELLRDPIFKRYLLTKPVVPPFAGDKRVQPSKLWVVYVQRDTDGPWGKREFWTYKKAFSFFKKALAAGVHDLAINNKRVAFDPPTRLARIRGKYVVGSDGKRRQASKLVYWKPKLEPGDAEHHWCRYCRRPTVFKFYSKFRRLGNVDPTVPRCCICGASARIALLPSDRMFRRN